MFGLNNIEKEIFPYSYYSKERYEHNIGNIDDAMKFIYESSREEFV